MVNVQMRAQSPEVILQIARCSCSVCSPLSSVSEDSNQCSPTHSACWILMLTAYKVNFHLFCLCEVQSSIYLTLFGCQCRYVELHVQIKNLSSCGLKHFEMQPGQRSSTTWKCIHGDIQRTFHVVMTWITFCFFDGTWYGHNDTAMKTMIYQLHKCLICD